MKKKKVRKGAAKSRSRKPAAKKTTRKKPATRKKKKTAAKSKKRTVKKKTVKKTTAKATKKKTKPAKRTAKKPVKTPARAAASPKSRVSRPEVSGMKKTRPAPTPVPPAPPPIPSNEDLVGIITHYYSELMVAVLQMNQGTLRVGDRIHVKGHTSDFEQAVGSMEIEHQHVEQVEAGQVAGLKVIDHAREHDQVYKIRP
jgi:hypothetical protein